MPQASQVLPHPHLYRCGSHHSTSSHSLVLLVHALSDHFFQILCSRTARTTTSRVNPCAEIWGRGLRIVRLWGFLPCALMLVPSFTLLLSCWPSSPIILWFEEARGVNVWNKRFCLYLEDGRAPRKTLWGLWCPDQNHEQLKAASAAQI